MFSMPAALVAMAITGGGTGETVLLDFYADWCGPCRSMNPTVEQLASGGYPVRRVNVDQYRDLTKRFGITSIPCFVMVVNGREAGRVVGPTSLGRLQQLCSLGRPTPNSNAMLAMPAPAAPAARGAPAGIGGPSVPVVPVVFTAVPKQPPVTDAAMLTASVRLCVEDPQGHSCGSGTIIDARAGGEALVLTCGHLFRDYQSNGKIDVDVFGPAPSVRLPGRLIGYDLQRDLGLVAFRPQGPVMVARVAPPNYAIRAGDAVTSVGCNNGEDPTVQHSQVISLDRFRGPSEQQGGNAAGAPHATWNLLEIAGQPVIGRSGGGLFSTDGMVIGVCNAAEPVDHEGLYATMESIHVVLDQQGLSSLYRQAVAPPAMVPPIDSAQSMLVAVDASSTNRAVAPRGQVASETPSAGPTAHFAPATTDAALPTSTRDSTAAANNEQAVMSKIRRRAEEGSEVVCIIRDRNNPQATSEVIRLDRASPAFVSQLARAGQPQNIQTSLEVPKRPTPILEWDINSGWLHRGPLP